MNLKTSVNHSKSSLKKCPSCETPASAASLYCGSCGCDLSPQSDFSWHEDRLGLWPVGSFSWEAS